MPKGTEKVILSILALAALAGFGYGVVRLWLLRFEAGDIYPPYSTLRTDPLGAKAFCQGLGEVPGVSVRRNYQPLERPAATQPEASRATLMLLGLGFANEFSLFDATRHSLNEKEVADALERFVRGGGRLVITFRSDAGGLPHLLATVFEFEYSKLDGRAVGSPLKAVPAADFDDLPAVPWHTWTHFVRPGEDWRVVYTCAGQPVIIERTLGDGTVVVSSDSYFLSNEAMLGERRPEVLAWLVGGNEVIFDETHLGVLEEAGVATLARRYHLGGLAAVLALLAGLFVWKSAASFLPRDEALARGLSGGSVAGRSAAAGLITLLQKAVPASELLAVCLKEWARSASRQAGDRGKLRRQVEELVVADAAQPKRWRNPVATYRQINRLLARRG